MRRTKSLGLLWALFIATAPMPLKADADARSDDDIVRAPIAEARTSTSHKTTIAGRAYAYDATAGTLTIRNDEGTPTGSMFYVAYVVKQDKTAPKRPVTFLFNGGPGSASLWLNVGGLGPMYAITDAPRATGPAPYRFVPSPHSLLDKSDLVFLDAIGTGYSRTLGTAKGSDFWGVDADIDAFARAITRYISVNQRWGSPKFLFGESYGTTRAAALVYKLQNQGMQFNGVMLLSSILNFAVSMPGIDQDYINNVPSFAATALYHNKLDQKPQDLLAFLREVRDFAQGPYATALGRGDRLSASDEEAVASQLSRYIGLSPDYLKRSRLRVGMEAFRGELLRDRGLVTGRFDSRFTAAAAYVETSGAFDPATNDPATAGVTSAYLSSWRDHLSSDLGYVTELAYRPLYNMVISAAWDWRHKAPGFDEPLHTANVALDLAAALRSNPQLKVLSMNGVYDLATPFFGAEFDLSHMLLSPELQKNLAYSYYESGHMTYADQKALAQMKQNLGRFYDETLR
jgi:carboxypeptidase C (cathepsin A)